MRCLAQQSVLRSSRLDTSSILEYRSYKLNMCLWELSCKHGRRAAFGVPDDSRDVSLVALGGHVS